MNKSPETWPSTLPKMARKWHEPTTDWVYIAGRLNLPLEISFHTGREQHRIAHDLPDVHPSWFDPAYWAENTRKIEVKYGV